MKILRNLKRTLAFVLTLTMLLTCVDSLSLASYAAEPAAQDISANVAVEPTDAPAVSDNADANVIENEETEVVEPEDTTPDVSDNTEPLDISDNETTNEDADVSAGDDVSVDVSDNDDLDIVSGNDLQPILKRIAGKPANIVVETQVLYEDGNYYYEDTECDTLAEAQQATIAYYNQMIQSNEHFFEGREHAIRWMVYDDLEIKGNNEFLDNEGIAACLDVYLEPYVDDAGKHVYPDIIVKQGATVETCAHFDRTAHSIDSEGGISYWGEKDGSDGSRLILGANSTFCIYLSELFKYAEDSYFWSIEDPSGNATLIVGKAGKRGGRVTALHIGSANKKVGKIICEADVEEGSCLNYGAYDLVSHGLIWGNNQEAYSQYYNTHDDVMTFYAKDVVIKSAKKKVDNDTYSYPAFLSVYGTAAVDKMTISGYLKSQKESMLTIKEVLADTCGGHIDLHGEVIIADKIDLLAIQRDGDDRFYNSFYIDSYYEDLPGLYLPKNIITHKYTYKVNDGSYTEDYNTRLVVSPWKAYYDENGVETRSDWCDYELGCELFYVESVANVSDQSFFDKIMTRGKSVGEKKYIFKDTKQKNGKTYKVAKLDSMRFYYAYANENGTYPEYTPSHAGLIEWPEEFVDFDGVLEGIKNAEFDKAGNVKVYVPIADNVVFDASGNDTTIGANSSQITHIEFVGNNHTGEDVNDIERPSIIRLNNESLSDGDTYVLNLEKSVEFRNVSVWLDGHGSELAINAADHNLMFYDADFTGYRAQEGATTYYRGGIAKVTAAMLMVINTDKREDSYVWKNVHIADVDVSQLILTDVRLFYPNDSLKLKDGINVSLHEGASLHLCANASDSNFAGYKLGTVTINSVGRDEKYDYYPISGDYEAVTKFSIDKLVVSDDSGCTVDFSDDYTECIGVGDIEIGKNARLVANSEDVLEIANLTVAEGGIFQTDGIKVTGDTILTDKSTIALGGWGEPKPSEFNSITLVKSDSSNSKPQTAYLSYIGEVVPAKVIGGIKSESSADEIRLQLRLISYDSYAPTGMFENSSELLKLLYNNADATPDEDMAYISIDTGSAETQPIAADKADKATAPYKAEYVVKPISFGIYASQKGEPFEKAKLVDSLCKTYDEAIAYIDAIGNANTQYYLVIDKDIDLKHALTLPKAGAGFGIVGVGDEGAEIRVTGNVVLTANLTLENVNIIATQSNATLSLNGKDLTILDANICTPEYDPLVLTGAPGNLTVRMKDRIAFEVAAGNLSFKSLNLENTFLIMDGKLTVSGDMKLKGSIVYSVSGDSKVSGNLYTESSCLRIYGGTFTVAKNFYSLSSWIEPYYEDAGIYQKMGDYMYWVANHKNIEPGAGVVNFTVNGNTYMQKTNILATGNVTLGTVYSGKDNRVYYGLDNANIFKVNTVVSTKFNGVDGYGYAEGRYAGSDDFEWVTIIDAGEGGNSEYKVVGTGCGDSFDAEDLYKFNALANAINVRRASVEKSYFNGDIDTYKYENGFNILEVSNDIAKLYKNAGNVAIVTTADTPAKFIVGKNYQSDINATVSFYSLKSTGTALVIDDTVALPVELKLVNSVGQIIGRFETLNDAFARINVLKNSSAVYEITIKDEFGGTNLSTNLTIPKAAVAKEITIKGVGGTTLLFKDALVLNTNVTFKDIYFESVMPNNVTLGGYKLELENCGLYYANSVKGSKGSVLKITADASDEVGVFKVSGDVTGVDVLSLSNVVFAVNGKATVGKLVLFDGAGSEKDQVRIDAALSAGKNTNVVKDGDEFKGTFDFTPKFTVTGEIENKGGANDVFTVLPIVDGESIESYVGRLYKAANGGSDIPARVREAWKDYVATGLPLIIAPKATVSGAAYDKASQREPLSCTPATSGIFIKKIVGNTAYVCYSSASHAPYTLITGETNVADFLTWAELVKSVNTMAQKRDYTVVLNADKAGVVNETAEELIMPAAANIKSLYIKAASVVPSTPDWKYTKDKLVFTCDTTLENINFVGTTTDYALTINTPVTLTISGKVSLGGRDAVIDGGKKGNFVLAESASLNKNKEYSGSGVNEIGAIKNMASVKLNGGTMYMAAYNATATKLVAPELSATDVELNTTGEKITLWGTNNKASDAIVKITNLTYNGLAGERIETPQSGLAVYYGKINVTNFKSDGGYLYAIGKYSVLTINNMTVGNDTSDNNHTHIVSPNTTVTGKTVVNNDNLYIGGYYLGALKLNGAIEVADGCTVKLEPKLENGRSLILTYIMDEEDPVGPFTFVVAPKAPSASIFKAALLNAGKAMISEYHGYDPVEFFLVKNKNNILGYNGYSAKATVYADIDDSNMNDIKGVGLLGHFTSYDEAIAFMNDKTQNYYLEINNNTSSADKPIKITAPAAAKAASLTVFSGRGNELYYSAAPSFANNVMLCNITLKPAKATAITLTGSNALIFNKVDVGGAITDIKATAGKVAVIGNNNFEISGSATVADLALTNSNFKGDKLTVSKTFTARSSTIDFKGAIALTDVTATRINDLKINYTRVYDNKGADKGSNLNIKGNVNGYLNLVMAVKSNDVETDYKLTAKEAQTIAKAISKLWFSGKNVNSRNIESLKIKNGEASPQDVSGFANAEIAKANGGFYLVGKGAGEAGENSVVLDLDTLYLDFNQAVARINEINDSSHDYTILFGTVTDTTMTDNIAHSKLVLPGDNKAKSVTVNGTKLVYSSADAVTVFGTVDFKGVKLDPVVAKDGTAPVKANASFVLKANSKTKESKLIFSNGTMPTRTINSITGVNNLSVLEVHSEITVTVNKISNFKEIVVDGGTVEVATASGIGKVSLLGKDPAFYTYGPSTIGDLEVAAGSDCEIATAINVDKNGNKSAVFTLTGKVTNNSSEPIEVAIFASSRTAFPEDKAGRDAMDESYLDYTKGVPMLIAKKADAAEFIPATLYGEWLLDKDDEDEKIIRYKNLKGEVIADILADMQVKIYNDNKLGFETYAKTWSDAVAIIDNMAVKENYTIELIKDKVNVGKDGKLAAMVTPKAANVNMLTVTSADTKEVAYTGALNPACNITFDNVRVQEYTGTNANGEFASKINTTGNVTLAFTNNTLNGSTSHLTFNTISVPKGTLQLGDGVQMGANGVINVGTLKIGSHAVVSSVAANKTFAKQTYGTITTDVTGKATLDLTNAFSKAVPTSAVSQLSITGKVAPNIEIGMRLFNAEYEPNGKGYKLAAKPVNADSYEEMDADYVREFLQYTSTVKAPVAKTAVLNAPFLDASQLDVEILSNDFAFYKINGSFYAVPLSEGDPVIAPVVTLETDINPDGDDDPTNDIWELSADFPTWEAVVAELNKVTNNDYKYKITLLDNIGWVDCKNVEIKYGKSRSERFVITGVDRTNLPMPAKVNDLTIAGNGKDFIFTGANVAIDSNIVFDEVRLLCLAKTNNVTNQTDILGKTYRVTTTEYLSNGALKLSIAKGRTVTLKNYRGGETNISVYNPEGYVDSIYVRSPYFGAITGAAGSKLVLDGGSLYLNGKITGLDTLELIGDTRMGTAFFGYNVKAQATALTVNNAVVVDSTLDMWGGAVNIKSLRLSDAYVWCDSYVGNEVTFEGNGFNFIDSSCGNGKGTLNVKKVNVNNNADNCLAGRQDTKGTSQITVSGISFAEGCEDNKLAIGVLYAYSKKGYGDPFVTLFNGQTVLNCPATVPVDAFTLMLDTDDSYAGHLCGEQGVDWIFERGTGNKNIVFKAVAN
ncbi:MAG: hypothetical protein K5679_11475 [Lachnospiraceae bacterium]|nr:hypothetical protein [Lachnospiraceae bacterium]